MPSLSWLPVETEWKAKLDAARGEGGLSRLAQLARSRIDFVQTMQIDRRLAALGAEGVPDDLVTMGLAVLGSSTVDQLLPALRVAALRRRIWLNIHVTPFGQYAQELHDPSSELSRFAPDAVLFVHDAPHLFGSQTLTTREEADEVLESIERRLRVLWRVARDRFGCQVIQQTVMPTALPLMGNNEHRLAGSNLRLIQAFNYRLRQAAADDGADLVAIDDRVGIDGLDAWHDPVLWHRAKQEISPSAAPVYGDLVLRVIAARCGQSAKCLVLDLDNTLWGGVIGDDGLEGIAIGQGSALGEAFLDVQNYAASLARRGIILAVCSKNDEANALEPFEKHPDMVLKRDDIACFVANWDDKAANLRHIARSLDIGLESLVFVDDNPFERNIVRRELPMVNVPELPDDPALYARCLADGGYFEALGITDEDVERTQLYRMRERQGAAREQATDMAGYLESLSMKMSWKPFDQIGFQRIVQLINKTNQFNLTTQRYTEAQVVDLMADPSVITCQVRLADDFGDHGMIAILVGRINDESELDISDWLMSCRVLGRGVEEACLNLLVERAATYGATALKGTFKPTAKNLMVADLFRKLGFEMIGANGGEANWRLPLEGYVAKSTFIESTRPA